jgi:hypothetical protein
MLAMGQRWRGGSWGQPFPVPAGFSLGEAIIDATGPASVPRFHDPIARLRTELMCATSHPCAPDSVAAAIGSWTWLAVQLGGPSACSAAGSGPHGLLENMVIKSDGRTSIGELPHCDGEPV